MPPKGKKEDPNDKPPEGENERLVTVIVSGVLSGKPQPSGSTISSEKNDAPAAKPTVTPRGGKGGAAPSESDKPPFVPVLRTPYFSLESPAADGSGTMEVSKTDPLVASEAEFSMTILNKKLTITPKTVETFLTGNFSFTAMSCAEPKPGTEVVQAGKGAKGAKKGGKGDGSNTARSDISEAEQIHHVSHQFNLSRVLVDNPVDVIELSNSEAEFNPADVQPDPLLLSQKPAGAVDEQPQDVDTAGEESDVSPTKNEAHQTMSKTHKKMATQSRMFLQHIHGFEKLTITIQCSAPLLCPTNIAKYRPVVVEVVKANNLPPITPLDLKHRMDGGTLLQTHTDSGLSKRFDGVHVKYKFLDRTVRTPSIRHAPDVSFNHSAVFFLGEFHKLEVVQELFYEQIHFELHDRESTDPNVGGFFGVASVSLRNSLEGDLRFVASTQVVGKRDDEGSNAAPVLYGADYLSFGTTLQAKVKFMYPVPSMKFIPPAEAEKRREKEKQAAVPEVAPPAVDKPTSKKGGRKQSAAPSPTSQSDKPQEESETAPEETEEQRLSSANPFLARAVMVMPYDGPQTKGLISSVMGTIMEFKRAGIESDVFELPSKEEQELREREAAEAAAAAAPVKGGKGKDKGAPEAPPPPEEPKVPPPNIVEMSTIDAVSGFEMMDGQHRILVVEGLYAAVQKLVQVALEVTGNDKEAVKILFNTELKFPARWYHKWPPLVKKLTMPNRDKSPEKEAVETEDPKKGGKGVPPIKPPAASGGGQPSARGKGGAAAADATTTNGLKSIKKDYQCVTYEEIDDEKAELDAGGVGARIRRMRLSIELNNLRDRQKNFLHRTLTGDCLLAIKKLCALRDCHSMINAVDHDYFPTSQEIIALERVAGQTLEVQDVCASDTFYNFTDTCVEDIVAEAVRDRAAPKKVEKDDTVDLTRLNDFIGRVLSFTAIPATAGQVKGYKSLGQIFHRYQHRAYMYVPALDHSVVCAFPTAPPHQLLRYCVTAQIVACDGDALLFVMNFESLAKNGTDTRNPSFVAKKRREVLRAPPSQCHKIRAEQKRRYLDTHRMVDTHLQYRDVSSDDDDDFVDAPPRTALEIPPQDESDLVMENYIVTNKRSALNTKRVDHSKTMTAGNNAGVLNVEEQAEVVALYHEAEQRIRKMQAKQSMPHAKQSQRFDTVLHRTASEDRKRGKDVSDARADDLKQSWVPPQVAYTGIKTGQNPMRVHGARDVLGDPKRIKSIFQAESAAEARELEEADRRKELEDWRKKIVVDDVNFRVSCKAPRDRTVSQLDQLKSVLEDEPKKHSIKKTYAPPAPASIREVEKIVPNEHISPKVKKHPDIVQFYYAKGGQRETKKGAPISDEERRSPLYGGSGRGGYNAVQFKK